jgi:methane/ammonia monooxygenase subunit A
VQQTGKFEGFSALDRKFDLLFVAAALFLVIAGMQVTLILWGGDWDFWTDWKDRQWWPPIASAANMVVPAALQYIVWSQFRLPLGATFGAVAIALATGLTRVVNMYGWAYFPLSFVWPATFIPQALLLDFILLWTRSFLITSIIGGMLWGVLFYPVNWVLLAPYVQPVEYHGHIMTVADVQGFEYVRTQTPEYVRLVEKGALRAFVEEITVVVAFFSGFVSLVAWWFGHLVGRYAVWPAKVFLKRM